MEAELLTMTDDEINQKVKAIKNESKVLTRDALEFTLSAVYFSISGTNLLV